MFLRLHLICIWVTDRMVVGSNFHVKTLFDSCLVYVYINVFFYQGGAGKGYLAQHQLFDQVTFLTLYSVKVDEGRKTCFLSIITVKMP